jgi:hypothetical protein
MENQAIRTSWPGKKKVRDEPMTYPEQSLKMLKGLNSYHAKKGNNAQERIIEN